MDDPKPKRTYKDTIFRSYFSTPLHLSGLHRHITGIHIPPEQITINTLKHVFFSLSRNDISYLAGKRYMVLQEAQSTLNQNIPLRMLVYVTLLYRKLLRRTDFFSEKRIPLPVPEFYEFYCGPKDQPPESTLRLSESFPKDIPFAPPPELVVTRFNIRYNEDIRKCCRLLQYKPLRDYSYFIYDTQRRIKAGEPLGRALAHTMEYCVGHDIMKDFLSEHEQEVVDMYSMSWRERAFREAAMKDGREEGREEGRKEGREEGREEGRKEGREEGREETRKNTALGMLRDKMDPEKIMKYTSLSPECIAELAKTL